MMPQMDGWEVCRRIRRLSNAPIIILTVLDQQESAIRGLALGADDYITKPFRPRLFLARVRVALNRIQQPAAVAETAGYDDGYLKIELHARRVFAGGAPVTLISTEFALLTLLLRNADRVCTFDQIINHLWGESGQGSFELVHLLISQLRKKIEPDPQAPWYLLQERSLGYRFRKRSRF
jgi:two-component system KDP operon response regulator KdpE